MSATQTPNVPTSPANAPVTEGSDFIAFVSNDNSSVASADDHHHDVKRQRVSDEKKPSASGDRKSNTPRKEREPVRPPAMLFPTTPEWYLIRSQKQQERHDHPFKKSPVIQLLHDEILRFYEFMTPTPAEKAARDLVVERVRHLITSMDPSARVECFGSYVTDTFLPDGDIDMVVFDSDEPKRVLRRVAKLLRSENMDRPGSLQTILHARVPIIKWMDRTYEIPLDLSCNQESGVITAKIVQDFMKQYPNALAPLVCVIKQFLSCRQLNRVNEGGLGSYSVTLMCVHLLQMHPMVQCGAMDPSKNLGVLFMEFLELYGHLLNYNEVCLNIKDSCYEPKSSSSNSLRLSIKDPGDVNNDVAKGTFQMSIVRAAFGNAFDRLVPLLQNYRPSVSGQQESFLSHILHVEEQLEFRRRLIYLLERHPINDDMDLSDPRLLVAKQPHKRPRSPPERTNQEQPQHQQRRSFSSGTRRFSEPRHDRSSTVQFQQPNHVPDGRQKRNRPRKRRGQGK